VKSFLIAAVLCGCRSASAGTPPPADPRPAQQPSFYCEHSHTNHAWSYQHRGIYVDPKGGVFRFEHERGDQALLNVPADSVTEQALLARFAPGRASVGTVAPAEMAERYRQVRAAVDGERSERRGRGADMGDTVSRCFLPDTDGIYREVFLAQSGDWEQHNLSPTAAKLGHWLDSLAFQVR
jgi:hypothetical protein